MDPACEDFISEAVNYLESPSLIMRFTSLVGAPLEWGIRQLPARAHAIISKSVEVSLQTALKGALLSVPKSPKQQSFDLGAQTSGRSKWIHNAAVMATGATGGFFGAPAMMVELPVSTSIMLRSMADIARFNGFNPHDPAVQLECLSLFAYGGEGANDDAAKTAYFVWRTQFSRLIHQAAVFAAEKTTKEVVTAIAKGHAPKILQLIAKVAVRFEVTVSEKLAAQAIPLLGAVGGGCINLAFSEHFGSVAMYHFGLQRLILEHGEAAVRVAYEKSNEARLLGVPFHKKVRD